MTEERKGERFGAHRVIEPKGALPQPAQRLDASFDVPWDNEIEVDVETLNVDAASFRQMEEASGGKPEGVVALVRRTVEARGKQHNPVTDSGGMLLGVVSRIGSAARKRCDEMNVREGDRVATLASLSLTPLRIDEVRAVRMESAQIDVKGKAIIADGAPFAKMPPLEEMPQRLALAVLDVAGAPIQVARRAKPGMSVAILGAGGKSGALCAVEARRQVGASGRVIGVESYSAYANDLRALGVCDAVIAADAKNALAVFEAVTTANGGEVALSICCVNVDGAEMATILPVREGGCAYFFSMTTSFARAALGAEGVGRDVELVIGNGYAKNHAAYALDLVRTEPKLRALFERRYA
jgi:L-erythro-3,5-diaminohexanoate dehydrogenase